MSDPQLDLIRYLGRVCVLLATPTTLKKKQLESAQSYAKRLGSMCDYFATHNDGKGAHGMAGTIRAELTILIHILEAASKPGRLGRPPKGAPSVDDLLALAEYNSFEGTHKEKLRHLHAKGLIILKDEDEDGKWRQHFARLNERAERFANHENGVDK
ncbi:MULTISPECIES: hypothetical protein [Bradyrhizobium]|uniref:hypothetical protein n=1 Tax=Bradyrhizobium TaxID=374 RepID=UPI000231D013|nr:hypothetical protein [Bradyrhizobium japonicum]KMJ98897.1 hypothetical protein CF64_11995 [Bradyrhizobium japonicum]MCS3540004.1 hypothetical protein [Bradyrhizobium japonicum]MCS3992793.1 hypothetical protein [Bradyrhizobium japonicum]MCS4021275.1 hypothetical protein [Bradyrhizobium japonicum]MCS4208384.1 hypothetical protein [Bradyrhizobium japonicum]